MQVIKMNIIIKQFTSEYAEAVVKLQQQWVYENITYGFIAEAVESVLTLPNDYFYIALDGETVVGYVTAEVIRHNEYNIFPAGADYLQINDLYVKAEYRNAHIGEKLLKTAEEAAERNGITHILISSATKDADAVRRFYTRNGYNIWTTCFFKNQKTEVRTYETGFLKYYRYVVIFARFQDKWIFCRNKQRDTYEVPGGHIEPGETALEAARRELYEETGAVSFEIKPVFDYSVHGHKDFSNGQVFLAEVYELGSLPDFEIKEIILNDTLPEKLTYPEIQPVLYKRLSEISKQHITD
jgi:8-oxo-dGTP diphosphatase